MKKTIRNLSVAALILILALSLTGCKAEEDAVSETITITDHNGDEVTIPKDVERIAVCDILPLPSVLTVFFDSAEKIVGMSKPSMTAAENGLLGELYPEILNADTGFISGSDVNVEELMKLEPDVVFYNATSSQLGEQLKKAGFNAVAISVNQWEYDCIETLNHWIELLGQIFPENDKSELVSDYSNEIYSMIQDRVSTLSEKEDVFFLFKYSDSTIMTSGRRFFGEWWAESIGAENAAYELQSDNSAEVNLEQVYSWNPNVIFITNFTTAAADDLYNNTVGNYDWSGINAVKNKKVYKMPLGMYRSYTPGVDTPITLLWLAQTVYPELFTDIDIIEKTIDYYNDVFGVTLTEEQAASIFAPTTAAGEGF